MVQGTMMASVRKKCGSTMRSKGTTSNIFSEQTDIEEARTYEEPEQPEVEKCATPVVTYAEGKLSFSCETEGLIMLQN